MFIPQKHKEANRVCYNSGIFITSNVYPDFGHQHDNDAIRRRLDVFNTCSLQRKDGSVSGKLGLYIVLCLLLLTDYLIRFLFIIQHGCVVIACKFFIMSLTS